MGEGSGRMSRRTDWVRGLMRLFVVLGLLLATMSPHLMLADDGPATPVTVDAPVDTTPESTVAPVETLVPPEETAEPPTSVPTDPPLEPTAAVTVPPPTDAPPTATEAAPTDAPSATLTPSTEPSPTPSPTRAEREAAMMVQGAASGFSGLTVDGKIGTALVSPNSTQTFVVGDLLDMAGSGFPAIDASNPDPDEYSFGAWWTQNFFQIYAGRGCQGEPIRYLDGDRMEPESGTATSTLSDASSTYSVHAYQNLIVLWREKNVGMTADEVTVFPAVATSNCVNVEMSADAASLTVNGQTGSVVVNEGDVVALLSDRPSGDTWTQSIFESTDAGCSGTLTTLVSGGPGSLVGTTLTRPPGTYWFGLRSTDGSFLRYGNCVPVQVQDSPAVLSVEGSLGPVQFIGGQELAMYVAGVTPGAHVVGWVYPRQ